MHCWVGGRMGKVGSTENISQLSAGALFCWINLFKSGWTKVREAKKRERWHSVELGGSMRMQCHETGSEDTNSPYRDWALLFKPVCHLCYSVRTHSSASPPMSKTQDMSEKPVGYGMCEMHILPTIQVGITAHGCFLIHYAVSEWSELIFIIYIELNKHLSEQNKAVSNTILLIIYSHASCV